MPRKDGTGPRGQGAGPGRGRGRGNCGQGGRAGGFGAGPAGYCVCPDCGEKASHQLGSPSSLSVKFLLLLFRVKPRIRFPVIPQIRFLNPVREFLYHRIMVLNHLFEPRP